MTISTRKLFGSTEPLAPAQAPAPAAASPEYAAWYAAQLARSYAASRCPRTIVALFREAPCAELPLAA